MPFTNERVAERYMRLQIVRLDRHCLLPMGDRLIEPAFLEQRDAEVVVRVRVIGTQGDRFFIMRNRLIGLLFADKRIGKIVMDESQSEVVVALGALRPDLERGFEM